MRPFKSGKSGETLRMAKRTTRKYVRLRQGRQRNPVACGPDKKVLRCSILNVDGMSEASLVNVESVVGTHKPDVVFLLETKRRAEEDGMDMSLLGYDVHEARRSNNAEDREGGGIAVYTKLSDGLLFKQYKPDILDPGKAFVNSERMWITVESESSKTAICGLYLGCQYSDDRHGAWNDAIYQTVQQEAFVMRSRGFRIVYLGDFNGHIGNVPEEGGMIGNTVGINPNGRRFLNFITNTDSVNINSMCKSHGDYSTRICEGLWTRQRGGHSSIIDFALISNEHKDTVISMLIDDKGNLGGGSDHNWIILDLSDKFVRKKRATVLEVKKDRWNISEDQDWTAYKEHISKVAHSICGANIDCLASRISNSILNALKDTIGLKKHNAFKKPRLLPPSIVREIKTRNHLEQNWKSLNSVHANLGSLLVQEAEALFNAQHAKVANLLQNFRFCKRSDIIKQCSGSSFKAKRNFWSHVSKNKKQNSNITAVIDPLNGAIKCGIDEITHMTENHLVNLYNGSLEKIPQPTKQSASHVDHCYNVVPGLLPGAMPDHSYSVDPSPSLPNTDSNGSLATDPAAWINRDFSSDEVRNVIKTLKNGKAYGWDKIPNEALKNLPDCMIDKLTILYNMIKSSGKLPNGWNRGRVTLIHKRGQRELLGNYRPITVLVSLSGLYSKILNERLIKVTEKHNLLGEIQNGFRKGRCAADNNFVLDTILWKSRALKKLVHMSFVDISKAYDTVNREILWKKLSSLGFTGEFLSSLKALYTNDSVDCTVNGMTTRPVFLRRGLRQGCALSPLLFALYIMDIGNDINLSELGFMVGKVCISGLLFADDLVLVARSSSSLKSLLSLVKKGFDKLKLSMNVEKSQVISPVAEAWEIVDEAGNVALTLDQVAMYKYLGTWTYGSMYRTVVEKQRQCVATAHKYKSSCIHVSRMGPDVVDVVMCTWKNVAVPAILTGCEMIPFCETRILEIERTQAQVAKFALGLSSTSPNVCAQTELGLTPFRQLLFDCQLKFYFRALYIDGNRWVHQALLDHLSGLWCSPYLQHIALIRTMLGIHSPIAAPSSLKKITSGYFLSKLNSSITNYKWIDPVEKLSRAKYVCENKFAATIAEFKLDHAGLGDKNPRLGYQRKPLCPVCPLQVKNSGMHMLLECSSVSALRCTTGIRGFMTLCLDKGMTLSQCYHRFVNGLDSNGNALKVHDYLERGKCMYDMRELWLSKW